MNWSKHWAGSAVTWSKHWSGSDPQGGESQQLCVRQLRGRLTLRPAGGHGVQLPAPQPHLPGTSTHRTQDTTLQASLQCSLQYYTLHDTVLMYVVLYHGLKSTVFYSTLLLSFPTGYLDI